MNEIESEPTYFATVTFAEHSFQLWRAKWTEKRTTFTRWYAKYDGQTEGGFHNTRSDSPESALGAAILLMDENDVVAHRIWR